MMIRFELLVLAMIAAPLSVPAYLANHVSHGCKSSQRVVLSLRSDRASNLQSARVSRPVLQMSLGKRFVRSDNANISDRSIEGEEGLKIS